MGRHGEIGNHEWCLASPQNARRTYNQYLLTTNAWNLKEIVSYTNCSCVDTITLDNTKHYEYNCTGALLVLAETSLTEKVCTIIY